MSTLNLTDAVIPVAAFILIIAEIYFSGKDWHKKQNVWKIIIGLIIMGFSLWTSYDNSNQIKTISTNTTTLLEQRKNDSIDNHNFRQFVKDSFGIEKRGDTAVVTNQIIYNNKVVNNIASPVGEAQKNTTLPDSLNYLAYIKDSLLYLAPKEGSWANGFLAIDTTQSKSGRVVMFDDMGTYDKIENVKVKNKIYPTYFYFTSYRSIFNERPLVINLKAYGNRFVIFGDEGTSKRYFYINKSVTWIPQN